MSTIATALINGNGKFQVAQFERGGDKFCIIAQQTPSECRTGKVSIYIKANNERAQRIGFYQDSRTVEELKEYVVEELLS